MIHVSRRTRLALQLAMVASAALSGSCTDRLLAPAAAEPPLTLSLSVTASANAAGTAEAFAHTDAAHLQLVANATTVLDTVVTSSGTSDAKLPIELRIRNPIGTFQISVDLTSQGRAMFHGTGSGVLRRGMRDTVVVTVTPVVAGMVAADSSRTLTALGDTVQATAAVVFANGDTVTGIQPSWTADGGGVVRVTPTGLVTAVTEGDAHLTASYQGFTAQTRVGVHATVERVALRIDSLAVSLDSTASLTATARDRNGNALQRSFTWTSLNPGTVTVDNAGTIRAVAPGTAVITASVDGQSASVVVVVWPATAVAVLVSPDLAALSIGETTRLDAKPVDGAGHALSGRTVAWSTSDPGVARVDAGGLVTAVGNGSAIITATYEGQFGTASIRVGRPVLAASTSQVGLGGAVSSGSIATQVEITNVGTGVLDGLSVSVSYAAGEPTGWLSATVTPTAAPAMLTLRADLSQLGAGVYHAIVTVTSSAPRVAPLTVDVAVTVGAPVDVITLSIPNPTVPLGGQQTLVATPRDAGGNPLPYTVTWVSLSPTIVGVSPTGVLTGLALGTGLVVATSGGASDTAVVTVVPASKGGGGGSGGGSGGSGGALSVVKRVVNDDGGTKAVGDFGLTTSAGTLSFGAGVADGTATLRYTSARLGVAAGTYSLHENAVSGYTDGTWSCTRGLVSGDAQTGSVTIAAGDTVTCTITNNDNPGGGSGGGGSGGSGGALSVVKRVVNDDGGTKAVGDFGLTTSAGTLSFGAGVADGTATLRYTSARLGVAAGTYSLHENAVSGYTDGTWSCTRGLVSGDAQSGSVTIAAGDTVTCTITNNDNPGGGSGGGGSGGSGGALSVVKRVVNDDGGTKAVGDFGLTTSAGTLSFGAGVADGTATLRYTSARLGVAAGTYSLHENAVSGYTDGTWSCTRGLVSGDAQTGSVTIAAGDTVTCTITNNDNPGGGSGGGGSGGSGGALSVVKRVVNDDGGTKAVGDFGLTTSAGTLSFGAGVADGTATLRYTSARLGVAAGTYSLHENAVSGYTDGTWSCTKGLVSGDAQSGSVTIAAGDTVTCTITNNDQPAVLRIVKQVKGAAATFAFTATGVGIAPSFTLTPPGVDLADTVVFENLPAGVKTITESPTAGYILTDLGCSAQGEASVDPAATSTVSTTLVNGETVTCTFINQQNTGTTRTQGFWATHESVTNAVWFGGSVGGHTFTGLGSRTVCTREVSTIGGVLGGFWSSISGTSTGGARSALDQARMTLLQQLLAAILNNAAFGSSPSGGTSIAQAKAAYCGTDVTAIQEAANAMEAFNTSGDNKTFTAGVSADGKQAKADADPSFWDVLP